MDRCDREPVIEVGWCEDADLVRVSLAGQYRAGGRIVPPGTYRLVPEDGCTLQDESGDARVRAAALDLQAADAAAVFTLHDLTIGRGFHWERPRVQRFHGDLVARLTDAGLVVINRVGLETYLQSVVCSEMGATAPPAFLQAHSIVSRSWLLAQLACKREAVAAAEPAWTDASVHQLFDVCADDHCQRYHGIETVNPAVRAALQQTRGRVLTSGGTVCDTRFSKCCGGITERFSSCWQDRDVAYLTPVADTAAPQAICTPPVDTEAAAARFIRERPPVFCHVTDPALLAAILPDFDAETGDFFRWRVQVEQEQLQELLRVKAGVAVGPVRALIPVRRGSSGRIIELDVIGTQGEARIGKELAIRRALSWSHLYSSCFVVSPGPVRAGIPQVFQLDGAGWGHGVGLCQIGAAAMAAGGASCDEILTHYFRGSSVERWY